jgi:large subunit ribosomal protein L25
MATETVELDALARPRVGKGAARQVRREGRVPAVIYGDNQPPEAIALNYNEIWKQYLKGQFTSTVFKLNIDGEIRLVVPRDMQLDPVRDTPIHIDFLRIGKDGRIRVLVPIRFINDTQSPGLKRGGVLNVVRHEIEVWSPYDRIPAAFTIDLTGVDIGRAFHVSALDLPEGISPTIADRDFTIATLTGRGKLAEAEVDETAAAAAAPAEKKK